MGQRIENTKFSPFLGSIDNIDAWPVSGPISQPEFIKDIEAVKFYLSRFTKGGTLYEIRSSLERLLQWSWVVNQSSILSLKKEDIGEYLHFLKNIPEDWVWSGTESNFIREGKSQKLNPRWRPFKEVTLVSSTYASRAIKRLDTFYKIMVLHEKIVKNPVEIYCYKKSGAYKQVKSSGLLILTSEQLHILFEAADDLADENPMKHERTLFILSAVYFLYLQPFNLVSNINMTPKMNDFFQDENERWWFRTYTKQGSVRLVAVSSCMLNALKRYRAHLGLSSFPSRKEQTSLLFKLDPNSLSYSAPINRNSIIEKAFHEIKKRAILNLKLCGQKKLCGELIKVKVTSGVIRDTSIYFSLNHLKRPMLDVYRDLGHTSLRSIEKYIEEESDETAAERHLSSSLIKNPRRGQHW